MYYPCSENKGADQLRGYCEADLHLCFRICKKTVFSQRGSFQNEHFNDKIISAYVNVNDTLFDPKLNLGILTVFHGSEILTYIFKTMVSLNIMLSDYQSV